MVTWQCICQKAFKSTSIKFEYMNRLHFYMSDPFIVYSFETYKILTVIIKYVNCIQNSIYRNDSNEKWQGNLQFSTEKTRNWWEMKTFLHKMKRKHTRPYLFQPKRESLKFCFISEGKERFLLEMRKYEGTWQIRNTLRI